MNTWNCGVCGRPLSRYNERLYCAFCSHQPSVHVINEFCAQCKSNEGVYTCFCLCPGVVLCSQCVSEHDAKAVQHVYYPVIARTFIKTETDLQALQQRSSRLTLAKAKLEENFQRIAACEEALHRRCNAAVAELLAIRDRELERLVNVRRELEEIRLAAISEVDQHLFDASYRAKGALASEVQRYCQGYENDFLIFSYIEDSVEMLQPRWVRISYRSVLKKPPKAKGKRYLPIFKGDTVARYIIDSATLSPSMRLSIPVNFNDYCICARVSYTDAFLCDSVGNCYLVDMDSGAVRPLPPLSTPRSLSGLIVRQGNAYLLGGCTSIDYLESCEYYMLSEMPQSGCIANMNYKRDSFNPCVYFKHIYAVGGRSSYSSLPGEYYSFEENTFKVFGFVLPCEPTLCVFIGEFCIASMESRLACFDTRTAERSDKRGTGVTWSQAQPWILNDCIFTVRRGHPTKQALKLLK